MYLRLLEAKIREKFFKGKVIIITGARQTGKTTLSLGLLEFFPGKKVKSFNCDNPSDREVLLGKDIEFLRSLVADSDIVFIDEGQKVETIGQTLKLLVDFYKDKKQIVVTGSSSFNLLDMTEEVLTGRKFVYHLFPLSLEEIYPQRDMLMVSKDLETYLIYGNYPEIVKAETFDDKRELIKNISSSYLYKDVLEFQQVKNSTILFSLLKALALQIGSEVSYNELANLLNIDKKTVERYIDLLEKNYIIFRLSPYSSNKRKEISKLKKIYFYDLGIRNAVINNFNPMSDRGDNGALWENFMIIERLKYQAYHNIYANNYFWRTYDGAEVDFVEERDGGLFGFEFKLNDKRKKIPAKWAEYENGSYEVISPKDIEKFVFSNPA